MEANSNAIMLPTSYGSMIVIKYDRNQFGSLLRTGEAIDHAEIVACGDLVRTRRDTVMIDAGACFGTWSLALADQFRDVHAFEMQRPLANCIAGSVALQGRMNVWVHNVVLTGPDAPAEAEISRWDYYRPLNFGSVESVGRMVAPQESLDQEYYAAGSERVRTATIDSFQLRRVSLIKVDCEGSELAVLAGARETIRLWRPVIFAEHLKSPGGEAELRRLLETLDYTNMQTVGMNLLALPPDP